MFDIIIVFYFLFYFFLLSEGGNFQHAWTVGQCLWRQEVFNAFNALRSSWQIHPQSIENSLINNLFLTLRIRQIKAIASTYQVVKIDFLMKELYCQSLEETLDLVKQVQWRHEPSENAVYPIPLSPENESGHLNKGLENSLAEMQRLTTYIAHLEKKSLHMEASKASATSGKVSSSPRSLS